MKNSLISPCVCRIVVGVLVTFISINVYALKVELGVVADIGGAAGHYDLNTYSESVTKVNSELSAVAAAGGAGATALLPRTIKFGFWAPRTYGPSVYGLTALLPKTTNSVIRSISKDAPIPGGSFTTSAAYFFAPVGGTPATYGASASQTPTCPGCRTAAEAIDPFLLSAGSLSYTPTIDYLNMTVSNDNEFGVMRFSASQTVDEGLETEMTSLIWELGLWADTAIMGASDVNVHFYADSSLLSSAPTLEEIKMTLFGDGITPGTLIFDGAGTVSYGDADNVGDGESFSLFSTTYTTSSDVMFSETVAVGASVVPVPASVWLFSSGLLGLVAVARRKAKANS